MKIAIIGNGNAIHTQRWVSGLKDRRHEVHLITAHVRETAFRHDLIHVLPFRPPWGYYLNARCLRALLDRLRADIVHVHYASGYGTLMRVCGYRPYVLSVWGSDVFEYPNRSRLCLRRIQKNVRSAACICSTSQIMARRVQAICLEVASVEITPFGIDSTLFKPSNNGQRQSEVVVGTVKRLEVICGIDILLRAFAAAREQLADSDPELSRNLRLRIVGEGSCEKALKNLARQLKIDPVTNFVGPVPNQEVPRELRQIDVFVAASRFDSFGVAVIEASGCGLPVIVSNKGGLPEVVVDRKTGLIVPGEDVLQTAGAIVELAKNPESRAAMGAAGRRFVKDTYEWSVSLDIMEGVYRKYLLKHRHEA